MIRRTTRVCLFCSVIIILLHSITCSVVSTPTASAQPSVLQRSPVTRYLQRMVRFSFVGYGSYKVDGDGGDRIAWMSPDISIEYFPENSIGIYVHTSVLFYQSAALRAAGGAQRVFGEVAPTVGFGVRYHLLQEYFIDPYIGLGFDITRYYKSWSQRIAQTGYGSSLSVGTNWFLLSNIFTGIEYTFRNQGFTNAEGADAFHLNSNMVRLSFGFAF